MRKLLCVFTTVLLAAACWAQPKAKVDERFELTSVAFRLAGAGEYSQCGVPSYAADITKYFSPYASHPLIKYIGELRAMYGIGYDAVSSSAAWLRVSDGRVEVDPYYRSRDISQVDSRWTKKTFRRYVKLLDRFYRETHFQKFYDDHGELYRYAEGQLDELLAAMDTDWFLRFYGKEFRSPEVYIGMCNGPSNYALTQQVLGDNYGIVMGVGSDNMGKPVFGELILSIVLHEFAHNFSNPISLEYMPRMEAAMQTVYPRVSDQMMMNAYGSWETTFGEFFNNLCMLMYYGECGQKEVQKLLTVDYQNRGFVWMKRAVEFMEEFYADREKYPYISDFMPRIVEFMDETSRDYDRVVEEYETCRPRVVSITPAVGETVDAGLTTITIVYSLPMRGDTGFNYSDRVGVSAAAVNNIGWIDDRTCEIRLANNVLESGKTYGYKFLNQYIHSREGYPLAGDNEILFTVE